MPCMRTRSWGDFPFLHASYAVPHPEGALLAVSDGAMGDCRAEAGDSLRPHRRFRGKRPPRKKAGRKPPPHPNDNFMTCFAFPVVAPLRIARRDGIHARRVRPPSEVRERKNAEIPCPMHGERITAAELFFCKRFPMRRSAILRASSRGQARRRPNRTNGRTKRPEQSGGIRRRFGIKIKKNGFRMKSKPVRKHEMVRPQGFEPWTQ